MIHKGLGVRVTTIIWSWKEIGTQISEGKPLFTSLRQTSYVSQVSVKQVRVKHVSAKL